MEQIVQYISTVGFPIVACVGVAWFTKYMIDKNQGQIDKIMSTQSEQINTIMLEHKSEREAMTTALNNNTLALTKLFEHTT